MRLIVRTLGLVALLFVASLAAGPGRAAMPPPVDLDIEIDLDAASRHLAATVTVTLPPGRAGRLRLDPAFRVEGDGVRRAGGAILVDGGEDTERRVRLRYQGTLPALDAAHDRAGASEAGSYLPPGGGWYPHPTDRGGVSHRLTVRVPAGRRAVASGALVDEADTADGYRATFESEMPGPGPVLLEGAYEITERVAGDVRLRTYFPSGLGDLADAYLDSAGRYLARFSEEIGSYPYGAFHVVAAPLPVGLGFTNMTYMSERILRLPFARGRSLAHEVLHNWWGGAVSVDDAGGNWAEGLTTYMADYAVSGPPGSEARHEMRLEWLRAYAALPAEREQALAEFEAKRHDAAQVVGYGKAAYVFHMLRRRLGEAGFGDAVRRFWQDNRGRTAGWGDLRHAAETAGGAPLDRFFRQWVERPGAPRLRLGEAATSEADGGGFATRLVIEQGLPTYDLRLPVRIETPDGAEETVVAVTARSTKAEIATRARPLRVAVDPAHHVFRRLAPAEVPPIFRDVTLAPRTALIVAGGDDAFRAAARKLAEGLVDAGAPEVLPSGAAPPAEGVPVIVLGPPEAVAAWGRRHGLPAPPEPVAGIGDARAWAARLADGRPVVAVAAVDVHALEALARPLPHYARRGYVAFEDGRAVAQGVAAPTDGLLARTLSRQAKD